MINVLTAEQWLLSKFSEGATLDWMVNNRFNIDLALNDSRYSLVELSLVNVVVQRVVGMGIICFYELRRVITVVDQISYEMIGAMMNRVLVVLDAVVGNYSGGVVMGCMTTQPFRFHEVVNG